jgi:hydroxymethylpyrimidine/phosphomethylpyrimidine kinase
VSDVHAVPVDVVRSQIDAVAADLRPAAVKTGMLATTALVETVAAAIRDHGLAPYVLDPVMVASSGDRLLDRDAEGAFARELFPLAALVTPNLDEAAILTGRPLRSVPDMAEAARALVDMGAGAALVKGGHLAGEQAVDVLWDGARERVWRRPRVQTSSTHGTGCTLSAAVTAGLARGLALERAVEVALDFVARAIASAPALGRGHGPVNHFTVPDLGADPASPPTC